MTGTIITLSIVALVLLGTTLLFFATALYSAHRLKETDDLLKKAQEQLQWVLNAWERVGEKETTDDDTSEDVHQFASGLSKREYFAAMAMQGFSANSAIGCDTAYRELANFAVEQADALLSKLTENEQN